MTRIPRRQRTRSGAQVEAQVEARKVSRADEGSITPLTIGFAAIALALILLAALITDVWLAQRKLFALADSAALAAAESFDPAPTSDPTIILTDGGVTAAAQSYLSMVEVPARYSTVDIAGRSPDGLSAEVTLRVTYVPALLSPFAPTWIDLEASATVRGALRL